MAVKAMDIVGAARQYIGSPYRWWDGTWPNPGPATYTDWQNPGYYTSDFVRREGVNCSGLINLARMECGLEPIGGTGHYQDWLEANGGVAFDSSTPGVPGAICVHRWEGGMGAGAEGHIAMYTDAHTLLQSDSVNGVWEGEQDYDSTTWAYYLVYGLMPDVDYSDAGVVVEPEDTTAAASTPSGPWQQQGWFQITPQGLWLQFQPGQSGVQGAWVEVDENGWLKLSRE